MTEYHIDFEPVGRRGQCTAKQSLLECAHQLGVELVSLCGGKGTCGRCKVQVLSGKHTQPTSDEREALLPSELEQGYRLACQTHPLEDCKVHIPTESLTAPQRTQVEGLEVNIRPDPAVISYHVEMDSPSLENHEADAERLLQALHREHHINPSAIDMKLLQQLSPVLRHSKWQPQVSVRGNEVVALGPWPSRSLGLAIDLGTTKIAGYLLDLSTGQVLASKGAMNPQIAYGEDVISRITLATGSIKEAGRLRKLAVIAVNQLARDLCAEVGVKAQDIVEAVVVGNTAMHHLLLGLPVEQLALSPYVPAVKGALDIKARDIGLKVSPGGYVHLLPNIAGFVGADHVAMLLATKISQKKGVVLALDIGTNTEVCLSCDSNMTSVSCASGPAFEGAHIKHGMRAADGAIEHMQIVGDRVNYQTIGGTPPVGICGSGIIDAMAELYLNRVLGDNGRMAADHQRVRTRQGELEFVLVSEEENSGGFAITITQKDIRELQLAKGAIRTGIQVLLDANSRSEEEIKQVIMAGAFGSYIDVASAVTIGMLPSLPLNRFKQVGNAAGTGAKMALISKDARGEAQDIAERVKYIELAATSQFTLTFAQANYLGKYRITRGKREVISIDGNQAIK
jgi:uncharacterized 2Fe-2S/4Fe-4S cluster protein (DUF4445 family)